MVRGMGKFTSPNTIVVGEGENARVITGKHIVIAVGGAPSKLGVPGEEWVIDSDGFFALEQQPKKVGESVLHTYMHFNGPVPSALAEA